MSRVLSDTRPVVRQRQWHSGNTGNEAVLVQRLSAGDETALVDIMDRYGGALMAFSYRLLGDKGVAEEIFQDTLFKVWQQARHFRMDGHLRAWLFRVARNSAIDYMRKKRPQTEELGTTLQASTDRPEREAEKSWLSDTTVDAVMALPRAYREVIELRYFQQMGYHEIAQILGIPVGTVKSRVSYALGRLGKLLGARGIDASALDG